MNPFLVSNSKYIMNFYQFINLSLLKSIGSLAALVYQHSLTPLALPIKLILPIRDLVLTVNEQKQQPQAKVNGNSNGTNGTSNVNGNGNTPVKQTSQQPVQDARHLLEKGAGK